MRICRTIRLDISVSNKRASHIIVTYSYLDSNGVHVEPNESVVVVYALVSNVSNVEIYFVGRSTIFNSKKYLDNIFK
jgi:hypothetical protein